MAASDRCCSGLRDPAGPASKVGLSTSLSQLPLTPRLFRPAAKAAPAPSLPVVDPSALAAPGAKDGEVKLIDVEGTTHAYQVSLILPGIILTYSSPCVGQWEAGNWTDLGEVTDGPDAASSEGAAPTPGKTMHEGKEFDYVFDIDVSASSPECSLRAADLFLP